MKYKRIRIISASGSGKTYLGEKVAELTGLSLLRLDDIKRERASSGRLKWDKRISLEKRKKLHDVFVRKNKNWVRRGLLRLERSGTMIMLT